MIKVNVKAEDLKRFIGAFMSKKYALLDEGYVLYTGENTDQHLLTIKTIVRDFNLDAVIEYTLDNDPYNNFYIDVYSDGMLRESNSLAHINTLDDLTEHLDG